MEILCLNICLLSESDFRVQLKFNKRRKLCRLLHVRDKFPSFTTERWLTNLIQFSYVMSKQDIQQMRNIALVHLNLTSSFLGNRESVKRYFSEMLIKFPTYPFPFSYGSMAVFIPKTYYSTKRTLASNSICEYFMLYALLR